MRSFIPLSLVCVFSIAAPAFADQTELEAVERELSEMNRLEQEAFVAGDCEEMLDLLADDISFYANGREMTKRDVGIFCSRIPRPFPATGESRTRVLPISADAGYLIKTITFPDSPKVEVVTKIWKKGADGWKMVHFQSTVTDLKPPGSP